MEAKDVIEKFKWKNVEDWSALPTTCQNWWGKTLVSCADVRSFVHDMIKDIACKLTVPYEDFYKIFCEKNAAFYQLLFENYTKEVGYSTESDFIEKLKQTLLVPDLSNLEEVLSVDKVKTCLKYFEELSDEEKQIVLHEIEKDQLECNI